MMLGMVMLTVAADAGGAVTAMRMSRIQDA
jgi:hypothetical protein